MLDKIVAKDEINYNNELRLNKYLADENVTLHFNAQVKELTENEVVVNQNGQELRLPYDHVLVATGMKSNYDLAEKLFDEFQDVYVIGDANKPGRIMEAVHQGYAVANNMF